MASDALISLVLEQLVSYAKQQVTQVTGAREEVGKLTVTLKIIQGVLADAEEKQVQDNAVRAWLAELKDLVYAADDVLDEWHTKTAISQLQTGDVDVNISSRSSTRKKVLSFLFRICHCLKDVTLSYDIGGQIKQIRQRLDVIAKEREQYGLIVSSSHNELSSITSLTTSVIDVSGIYGRDDDEKTVLGMLFSDASCQERAPIPVISIVGTGGFGKTTLAKLIFNREKVKMAFEKRIWVCVSEPFDFFKIAKDIIEQATGHAPGVHSPEALHQCLSDSVKEKKFLLILDDVWTQNPEQWKPLESSLRGGSSGSRIIMTTRNREVAVMMGSNFIHNLRVLSEKDSWSLLSHVALRGREEELEKFKKIGREIAGKCKGVPLAIQTVGALLCSKKLIIEWRDVANNKLWELPQIKQFFLPSLLISYYSLPSISRQCFLFCAVFPKDFRMLKSQLVRLWMASGFFGYGDNNELEKMGELHFDILAMRSFFQDFHRDSDETIISCQMHDLVHDFAQFLSQGECFSDEDGYGSEFDASKVRHLCSRTHNVNTKLSEAKNLRTFMGFGEILVPHVHKLVRLRTLDLSEYDFEELPSGVCKLLHLRYLDLSHNDKLSELPEEICNLYNLQSLTLVNCYKLRELPERIGDLSNLRHLDIKFTEEITYLPQGIKRLIFLRTLSRVIVDEVNAMFKIGDLKHLNKLQGRLKIKYLGRITDANEAGEAELHMKNAITSLSLDFKVDEGGQGAHPVLNIQYSVLEKLQPHEHLEKLEIQNYPGYQFPGWMHDSSLLSNVVEIKLKCCYNCKHLPPLGRLKSLETLRIRFLWELKRFGSEFFGGEDGVASFPRLKRLDVRRLDKLEDFDIPSFLEQEDASIMPSLRLLLISGCPKMTKLPAIMKYLEILRLYGLPNWNGKERRECLSLTEVTISDCQNLKLIPYYIFSPSLRTLEIRSCSLLEKLIFGRDEGTSSEPLPINNQFAHPSLRNLEISYCESIDFDLKDLQQFTTLQDLHIICCPRLEKRFQGEEWRTILSHVPKITLDHITIK